MNSNNNELTAQIKSALPIEDIIGEKVRLRTSSRGFMGLCPFHQEDTPSFHVYTDTQSYYCFGCHESGDIITFTMKTENLNYPETLKLLADRAGVKMPEYSRRKTRSTYDILGMSAKFFRSALLSTSGTAAREYMKRRNMGVVDVDRFAMGYSPNSWDALTRHLRERGIPDREILSSGMAVQGQRGGIYDRFRGRLMFGIRDIAGKVIAFGGRLLDGEGAKYINSPESGIYRKRSNLYLLDTARKFMREKGRSILVEGYMDAVRLHKCGFGEGVASLGTSLTEEQAELLYRFADKCCICYDSDTAGQSATMKGMYVLAEHGLDVRVVRLPEGKDPDEYLCSHDAGGFEELLERAEPLITHHLHFIAPRMREQAGRKKVMEEFFSQLERLDYLDVIDHKAEICGTLNIRPSDIDRYINTPKTVREIPDTPKIQQGHDDSLECALCAMLYMSPELRMTVNMSEMYDVFSGTKTRNCLMDIATGSELNGESLAVINRGNDYLLQIKGPDDAEKWEKIFSSLMWHKTDRRIKEIQALPAAEQDIQELMSLIYERTNYKL